MAVYIPKLCTHLVMDEIDLVAGLGAFGVSVLPVAFAVLRQSGRSSPRSMNCPDSIFLTRFPGMGGTPSPMATGWVSWEKDTGCEIGGSSIGLIVGRWSDAGSGRLPTAGEVAGGCLTN